jgi:4-amino-4-deoxy-L-arabinose transferase-like glycosyltransferase
VETSLLQTPVLSPREDLEPREWWLSTTALVIFWVLAGMLLMWHLYDIPLHRTQEARVLEVGREMLHRGFEGWMIPHANGVERLHKPPLTYGLSAMAYHVLGVSAGAGRVPTVIAGWLTIGLVFWITKWLFSRRAGFFAAGALFSSYLFFKFFRLAETDPLSCLFTTAATFFFWRGIEVGRHLVVEAGKKPSRRKEYLWYHAGAAVLGIALMAKGPQVVFPLLFFVCYAGWVRQWGAVGRLVLCGAPVTFAVFGLPWWVYVFVVRGAARWRSEIENNLEGNDHGGWFYIYFPLLLYDVAPWCAFMVASLVESARHVRRDWRHLGLMLWILTIFIPLCFTGNKQIQYLVPLMPPMLIAAGWLVSETWRRREDAGFQRAMYWILLGTMLVCLLLPIGILLTPHLKLHQIRAIDWTVAPVVFVAAAGALGIFLWRGLRAGLLAFTLAAAISVTLVVGWWVPSLDDQSWEMMEDTFQSAGDRPVVFYAQAANLRFSFAMRQVVPVIDDPQALKEYLQKKPNTLVVVLKMGHHLGLEPPDFLKEQGRVETEEEVIGLYGKGP